MKVLLLFFCSGATALVYEVLWSKYLSLMFGSTVQAQTAVLAVFMGGLALGNRLFGKKAQQVAEPLAMYGYLEVAIGLYGFFFNYIYQGADWLFISVGKSLYESSTLLLIWKGLLAALLLLGPTIMMGGTLPLLASWLERRKDDPNRRIARFYSVNSLGAVAGAGIAGFYLVTNWGMVSSLYLTGIVNVLIGLAAIILTRRTVEVTNPVAPAAVKSAAPVETMKGAGLLVAATGGISMGLEVLSSRVVGLIAGGSLQAFALVLMAFILGIGLGSAVVANPRVGSWDKYRTLYGLLLGASTFVGMFVIFIEDWVVVYSNARNAFAANANGYIGHQALVALMALIVLGIPAALLGAVLPLTIRLFNSSGSLSDTVGRLLTWNTIGAVIGVLTTGFVAMPLIGLRGSLVIIAVLLAAIVALLATRNRSNFTKQLALGAVVAWVAVGVLGGEGWRHVLGAGLYRIRGSTVTKEMLAERKKETRIAYYKDAADATVSVEMGHGNISTQKIHLRINGKTDASTHGDLSTQYLLAHLPLIAKPDAKQVFVLGFGSGITSGAVTGHPIDQLTIAENCGPVLEAGEWFKDHNRDVLHNSKVNIRREDARTVLKLSPSTYDVIISEPSNPWVAGIGSVFSLEFYELAASKLNEGGVMAQWFHIYEIDDQIVSLVIRTFQQVFPHVELWDAQEGDIILLGSKTPWKSDLETYQNIFARPEPKKDLEKIGLENGAMVMARHAVSQRLSPALTDEGPIQTDEFPILEYAAPRAFFIGQSSGFLFNLDERTLQFPLAAPEKIQTLQNMPEEVFLKTFSSFSSYNNDLARYIRDMRNKKSLGTNAYEMPSMDTIIFKKPENYRPWPLPPTSSDEVKQMIAAETLLYREPNKWQQAVKIISEQLIKTTENPWNRDYYPARFAEAAARVALAKDKLPLARELINLGLGYDATHAQLSYLNRVLTLFELQKPQAPPPPKLKPLGE